MMIFKAGRPFLGWCKYYFMANATTTTDVVLLWPNLLYRQVFKKVELLECQELRLVKDHLWKKMKDSYEAIHP